MRVARVARPGRTSLASSEGRGRGPHALRSSGTCHPFQAVNKVNGVGWHGWHKPEANEYASLQGRGSASRPGRTEPIVVLWALFTLGVRTHAKSNTPAAFLLPILFWWHARCGADVDLFLVNTFLSGPGTYVRRKVCQRYRVARNAGSSNGQSHEHHECVIGCELPVLPRR